MEVTFFDIHSTKARQFGFRAVLPDGKIVCCPGDEPLNPLCEEFAKGADWLFHEAFCLYRDREIFSLMKNTTAPSKMPANSPNASVRGI